MEERGAVCQQSYIDYQYLARVMKERGAIRQQPRFVNGFVDEQTSIGRSLAGDW